jgi:Gluconate 2-dehydrogenase subunit 3
LDRRKVLKLLAMSSTLPTLPAEVVAALRAVHDTLVHTTLLKTLSPHMNATVTAMAELIIPQTETTGAKAVRVNEFIDVILSDWYSDGDRAKFLAGLAEVDARTRQLYGKYFNEASPEQQASILTQLGDEMAKALDELSATPRGYRGSDPEPEENFYFMFRQLVLTGYFTSEAGFTQQLQQEIIPGRYDGCIPTASPAPEKAH